MENPYCSCKADRGVALQDVVLLDDCLSAVDASVSPWGRVAVLLLVASIVHMYAGQQVGAHIWEHCISDSGRHCLCLVCVPLPSRLRHCRYLVCLHCLRG